MSNPINSLKKVKRTPLSLPEMSKTPKLMSGYDNPPDSERSEANNNSKSPPNKMFDLNMGYVKSSPRSSMNSSRLASSFNKHSLLGLV